MSERALYVEGVCVGGLRIRYLLIMWFCRLPQAVTVNSHQSCEAARVKINNSKSETVIHSQKRGPNPQAST